jgi:hypothetical protein
MTIRGALVLSVAWLQLACSGVGQALAPAASPPGQPRPAWTSATPAPEPGFAILSGSAQGARDEADALRLATADALSSLAQSLGVTVNASLDISESESSAQGYRYSIQDRTALHSRPIEVRQAQVVRRHLEREGGGVSAWVQVRVPQREVERLKRELRGLVVLAVECRPEARCPDYLAPMLRDAASVRGLKLASAALPAIPRDASTLAAAGDETGAARVLGVVMTVERREQSGAEHYAWVSLDWSLRVTEDGAAVQSVRVGPVKGGEYSAEAAMRNAAKKALGELAERLAEAP